MHKNENARNFYTCNDTSIKNLGFIDFTEVYYKLLTGEQKPVDPVSSRRTDLHIPTDDLSGHLKLKVVSSCLETLYDFGMH